MHHVVVGMSGGVDSSVTAYLLKKAGFNVHGVFMQNWEEDTDSQCPIATDIADAQAVCDQLNIELSIVNFAQDYWERVFAFCLEEFRKGRTPNPDILCNKEIKFSVFLAYAKKHGADFIATGHYARLIATQADTRLLKGHDPNKDQSYFLYALNQQQLNQSLFPIGDLTKSQVRSLAQEIGLNNHAKKDSTGICFVGERKFKTFLNEFLPAQPGNLVTESGEVIGQHMGLMFYTMGQRQGLCIGGKKGKSEQPWYVAGKDLQQNNLIVVQGENHPALFRQSLKVVNLTWIGQPPQFPAQLHAKTRYRQADQACRIELSANADYRVIFASPQRAITPGQSIVFYQDDICLGGGIIEFD